jgi:multidrug efflux pump subunit AcrA (membrane-fusion protein)
MAQKRKRGRPPGSSPFRAGDLALCPEIDRLVMAGRKLEDAVKEVVPRAQGGPTTRKSAKILRLTNVYEEWCAEQKAQLAATEAALRDQQAERKAAEAFLRAQQEEIRRLIAEQEAFTPPEVLGEIQRQIAEVQRLLAECGIPPESEIRRLLAEVSPPTKQSRR